MDSGTSVVIIAALALFSLSAFSPVFVGGFFARVRPREISCERARSENYSPVRRSSVVLTPQPASDVVLRVMIV